MLEAGIGFKLLGSVLIVAASIGFSVRAGRELSEHLELLYEMRRLFVAFSCEASLFLQPVGILFSRAAAVKSEELSALFSDMAKELGELQSGAGEEIWRKHFFHHGKKMGLSRRELYILSEAGRCFFGESITENEKQFTLLLEQMDILIEESRRERYEKQRIYQTCGVACGLMVVLILI